MSRRISLHQSLKFLIAGVVFSDMVPLIFIDIEKIRTILTGKKNAE